MPATSAVVQRDRLLQLTTPLETDVLLLERVNGNAAVSSLFSYHLELLADRQRKNDTKVKPEELVGSAFTATMELADGSRCINGIVKQFVQGHADERFAHYTAEIVPWMWLLTLQSDCCVYQDQSTPDIVKFVLDTLKELYPDLVNYELQLMRDYEKWDCCIQYRETDFNFISRLMEHEGIFYFFRHSAGKHTLVIADSLSAFEDLDPVSEFHLEHEQGYGEREDTVNAILRHVWLQPGSVTTRDHHFELPGKTLQNIKKVAKPIANNTKLDMYDYPGEFAQYFNEPGGRLPNVSQYGEVLTGVRSEEDECAARLLSGDSCVRCFMPGFRFDLDASDDDLSNKYVLLSVDETILQNPSYVSDDEKSGGYSNRFTCIPFGDVYRPRRITPKPLISGPQTAVVTVKKGEESWLDKYGRIRLQFHWDQLGQDDEKSTCWVRVAQPWAGARWGAHFWPRVGQEVVVEFLEGDPDKPLITGSVYNAANMPPYELPANYTRSGIITRSSKQGGAANFNELRFEDKKGDEQLFINAEKDMDLRVEHDSREYIMNDSHQKIDGGRVELVAKDKHTHLKADYFEKIDANVSRSVGSDEKEQIKGNRSLKVNGSLKESVGQDMSLKVGTSYDHKTGTKHAVEAGQEIHLKAGVKVILEAGLQLTIKASGGFVDIGPSGVTIQGMLVNINSGGSAGSGSGCSPKDPEDPKDTKDPDVADDGSKGGKMN